jgi:hypothetical protein
MLYRLRDWLADSFQHVQYPPQRRRGFAPSIWKNKMPWEWRVMLAVAGAFIALLLIPLAAFLLFVVWTLLAT